MPTAQHELIDSKLPAGTTLRSFVASRRRRGLGWRAITNEVFAATGFFVSHTTIRRWFADLPVGPSSDISRARSTTTERAAS